MQLFFSPLAEQDLAAIADYIATDNPSKALDFIRQLRERCLMLELQPESGIARAELGVAIRSLLFGNYLIFYTLQPNQVRIERIIHGARDYRRLLRP
jgi:toxin ParE1/3/4